MTFTDGLRAGLDRLVGTWRTEGRMIDGGEDHGSTWGGHDIYEWFPGGEQMIHRVDVEMSGTRNEAIEVFSPREEDDASFDETSFEADGSIEHGRGSFDAGGRYHNDSEQARATLSFEGPDTMSALWEMRSPEGEWADWMDVTFTRVGPPHIEIRSKNEHAG